ncbi:hypothetical protein HI914_07186 [Erysiphe necator]|nr:hypothetical protein HI914_07186 [Erysiphe necator]
MSLLTVPIPSSSILSPNFKRYSHLIDFNKANSSSTTSSQTAGAERSVFKTTEDAFEELQRNSIRREAIAKEYSKALDEVSDRMREAKMNDQIEGLTAAFAQVLRIFALGDQSLNIFQEFYQYHQLKSSLPPSPPTKSPVFNESTISPSRSNLILALSPTDYIVQDNLLSVQRPEDQLNRLTVQSPSQQDLLKDNYVNDRPYCKGWSKVSSQYRCKQRRGCNCAVTGECLREVFYNYLIDETVLHENFSLLKKQCVIEVSGPKPETPPAEEIRVSRRNLGTAYAYYARNILNPTGHTTLLSISSHHYKSVCFMADCVILAVSKDKAQNYGVVIDTPVSNQNLVLVMCMRQDVVDAIVEAVRNIGRNPIIPTSGSLYLSYRHDAKTTRSIRANVNNIYTRDPRPIVSGLEHIIMKDTLSTSNFGIFALGTAQATITVSLLPCFQKEGNRPSNSRVLEYLVHAISCRT